MRRKTFSKWDKQVLTAKAVINRYLGQAKRELENKKISQLLYGKSLVERIKMLIK